MKKMVMVLLAAVLLLVTGCAQKPDAESMAQKSYRQISQEEAAEMMTKDDGHIIVDVRRQDEYEAGHIPGAVLIPNESIGTEQPEALPDLNQIILIYCRSGNRSKQAAQKLSDIGYTNIYEFGGIISWKGEIVTGTTGAASTEESGAASMEESGIPAETGEPVPTLVIEANGHTFYAVLQNNTSAEALAEKLGTEAVELDLHDYGHFEKVGSLPWTLPRNDETITTVPGDVILYQGNQITIYYDENTWDFTRLAKIENITKEELLSVFGEGNVSVKLWVQ